MHQDVDKYPIELNFILTDIELYSNGHKFIFAFKYTPINTVNDVDNVLIKRPISPTCIIHKTYWKYFTSYRDRCEGGCYRLGNRRNDVEHTVLPATWWGKFLVFSEINHSQRLVIGISFIASTQYETNWIEFYVCSILQYSSLEFGPPTVCQMAAALCQQQTYEEKSKRKYHIAFFFTLVWTWKHIVYREEYIFLNMKVMIKWYHCVAWNFTEWVGARPQDSLHTHTSRIT